MILHWHWYLAYYAERENWPLPLFSEKMAEDEDGHVRSSEVTGYFLLSLNQPLFFLLCLVSLLRDGICLMRWESVGSKSYLDLAVGGHPIILFEAPHR